jgi:uncharacterized membrane protein
MIDLIFAIKFVHDVASAAMFGTWLAVAIFMHLARRSRNTSVVALTSHFAVRVELTVMIAAIALQPLSGFPLAWAVGLSPGDDFWIALSLALYGLVVAAWLAALLIEFRIRSLTRQAALEGVPLPQSYYRLYRFYAALVWPALAALVVIFLLMAWQPRLS